MLSRQHKDSKGFALVLVLSFVVLLVVVVLAFFSNAILQRQISSSSSNSSKAELFAQGALNTTVGDLQQEIADGSTGTAGRSRCRRDTTRARRSCSTATT